MVIEVTKEVDVVRIGIDKYSLKTGLKFKSIMVVSLRVLKEPRGFIRILQCVLAIVAFSTTASFAASCAFEARCDGHGHSPPVTYAYHYPFRVRENLLDIPLPCEEPEAAQGGVSPEPQRTIKLAYDYSSPAEFFVATGVVSMLYALSALCLYVFFHQQYASDPKLPVFDLGASAVLAVLWLAGSSAWAQGVADLKFYLQPEALFGYLQSCQEPDSCRTLEEGEYAALNVSLVLGYACFLLWLSSLWFVYKETVFHSPSQDPGSQEQNQNQFAKGADGRV